MQVACLRTAEREMEHEYSNFKWLRITIPQTPHEIYDVACERAQILCSLKYSPCDRNVTRRMQRCSALGHQNLASKYS
jgi:hypothetical protein